MNDPTPQGGLGRQCATIEGGGKDITLSKRGSIREHRATPEIPHEMVIPHEIHLYQR
jgi:hypothetical protein